MKKHISKRVLTLVLALVLVFALSLGAFAAWNSFQGNNDNNGTISIAPPTSTPTVTEVDLSVYNPNGDVYSGVDVETVIGNGVAYTLYNGGVTCGYAGGARLRATTVSTGAQVWDIQVDACVNNESQIATPYLDTASGKLYTAISFSTPVFYDTTALGWTASGNAAIDTTTGVATFSTGGGAISKTITIDDDVNYLYLPSNLVGGNYDGTYTISLLGSGTPIQLASGSVVSWGTFDSYTGTQIAAGTYTLKIEVTGNIAAATMNQIVLKRSDWRLYCISDLSASYPTVTQLLGSYYIDNDYEGQINTPIYCDGDGNIYFGVYGGTHSYYQLNTATLALAQFNAGSEDFYWAGAVKVNDGSQDYIVFGGDSGTVYVREKNDFDNSGTTIDLESLTHEVPGQIRSSMVAHAGKVYFTSKGTPYGWIWSINTAAITAPVSADVAVKTVYLNDISVSTPVISDNDIVYIGTNNYDSTLFTTTGRVEAYELDLSCITQSIYSGDPVQASPIVYSGDNGDYIYFTTNAYNGMGYCYSFDGSISAQEWSAGGTSSNCYTLQGFSSDNGYLIYGDDAGRLYIMH